MLTADINSQPLPIVSTVLICVVWAFICFCVAVWISHYYARKGTPWLVHITSVFSYMTSFMSLFVIALDLTGQSHDGVVIAWYIFYGIMSVACWVAVPFLQSYYDNGGFTFRDRFILAVIDQVIFFGVIGVVGGIVLLAIYLKSKITAQELWSLLLNMANTWGFVLLTFLYGSGLVQLPLSLWNSADRQRELKFCLFKLGKLHDKMQTEQDLLQQTNRLLEDLQTTAPPEFFDLLAIIRAKLPPPTAYSFASVSLSHCLEPHRRLDKIKQKDPSKLKRKDFMNLHYITLNHRRSVALLQFDWNETIQRYITLNHVLILRRDYTFSTVPQADLIAPGEVSYGNYPGSIFWRSPCCGGQKESETGLTYTLFDNKEQVSQLDQDENITQSQTIQRTTASGRQLKTSKTRRTTESSQALTESSLPTSPSSNSVIDNPYNSINYDDESYDIEEQISQQPVLLGANESVLEAQNYMSPEDDINEEHGKSITELRLRVREQFLAKTTSITSWLWRAPPPLERGTVYFTLTWHWFRLWLYLQPIFYRLLAIITAAISLLMLWTELSIMIRAHNLSPLARLAHVHADPTTLALIRVIPATYVMLCTYYTVFNLNLGWFYHMKAPFLTSETSMLFGCTLILRTIFTIIFNYYQLIRVEDTAFFDVVGPMELIPILGSKFYEIMPAFVIVFAFLTIINCWGYLLKCLGIPNYDFRLNDKQHAAFLQDGRILIDRHQRRLKGEKIGHFRSTADENALSETERARAAQREAARSRRPKRESKALQAIQEREQNEKNKRYQTELARSEKDPNWNTMNSHNDNNSNRYRKFQSQREKATNLDSW